MAASTGLFFGLLAGLAIQERLAAPQPAAAAAAPREIVKRRVVLTRIVVHERGRAGSARTAAPAATTAPAPAPPPPAPAPLTTRTS